MNNEDSLMTQLVDKLSHLYHNFLPCGYFYETKEKEGNFGTTTISEYLFSVGEFLSSDHLEDAVINPEFYFFKISYTKITHLF